MTTPKPFTNEANALLRTIHTELTHYGNFSVIDTERTPDGSEEITLAWVSNGVHSTFVIDPATGAGYFISFSPAGELADMAFPTIDAMRENFPIIINWAMQGVFALFDGQSMLVGENSTTPSSLNFMGDTAMMEWEQSGTNVVLTYKAVPDGARIGVYLDNIQVHSHHCVESERIVSEELASFLAGFLTEAP